LARFELQLRFESLPLAGRQLEVDRRDHLAGAFADPHVAGRELARIRPVRVVGRIVLVTRYCGETVDHLLAFRFADAGDELMEGLARAALLEIAPGDPVHRFGMRFDGTAPIARP